MNEQHKNSFAEKDKALTTAESIFKIGISVCGIIFFIIGFIFLFTELFFLGFLTWILGGLTLFGYYIHISLKLGYYRDIKLIRNKLYGIENETSTSTSSTTTTPPKVITPENDYMAPYYK